MFTLATDRTLKKKHHGDYFPICKLNKGRQYFMIKKEPYAIYEDKLQQLVNCYIEDEMDKIRVIDCVEEKKIPRGKLRLQTSCIINALDEYFARQYSCDDESLGDVELVKIPNVITRDAICVYGSSGSGKSFWAAKYANMYKELFPDNEIYLITTNVVFDDVYEGLGVNRLTLDNRDMLDELDFDETTFADSLVIFDDIESPDLGIYTWIRGFRDMLFQKSRKHNTYILNIIHKGLDAHNSRIPNNECNGVVVFPGHAMREARKVMKEYVELTNVQISTIRNMKKKGRAVYIARTYPKYAISEKEILIFD